MAKKKEETEPTCKVVKHEYVKEHKPGLSQPVVCGSRLTTDEARGVQVCEQHGHVTRV